MFDLSKDSIQHWLEQYAALGPLPGILVPLLEAFLPFLPLIAIVVANASAYSLWLGFAYSWIGASVGALLVFMIARRLGHRLHSFLERRFPKSRRLFDRIEHRGFTPLFILSCFPFSPSFLINIIAGISEVPTRTFMFSVLLGKGVMIFILSFLGYDVFSLNENPWKIVLAVFLILFMWWVGRLLERKYGIH